MSVHLTRRQFIQKATMALGAGFVLPTIIPARARGADGHVAPSNRLTMGCIGLGAMGTGNLQNFLQMNDLQIIALCDVDRERLLAAQKSVEQHYRERLGQDYRGCATYNDFRELLARPEIDTVSIAVPDHWHALTYVAAARAGKDIYGEKPLALTLRHGRVMSDAVRRRGCVFQTGSWQRSVAHFRQACELVRNGRIGQIHTIQVGLPGGSPCPPQREEPVPDGFDYDLWLGPAPWAPYTKLRCHWNFRWNFDYSGGQVTDWGAHHHDIVQWALGTEQTGPVEFEGQSIYPAEGLWNTATDYLFTSTYANGTRMLTSNRFENGIRFEGSEGWIFVSRERIDANPKSLLKSVIGPGEVHLYQSDNHYQNFIDCVRSRAATIAPIETAHRSISIAHVANIAMALGRKVRWDPVREECVNDPEANRLLTRSMRAPWQL